MSRVGRYAARDKFHHMFPTCKYNKTTAYDFVCNGKTVKTAAGAKHNGVWEFSITPEHTADFFAFFAFENGGDNDVVYTWIVPSKEIANTPFVRMNEHSLDKWDKYRYSGAHTW